MLQITLQFTDGILELPPLHEGQKASLTDYTKPEKELVIFTVADNKGYVLLSKVGASIEFADKRIVISDDITVQRVLEPGRKFIRDIMTKHGKGILIAEYIR